MTTDDSLVRTVLIVIAAILLLPFLMMVVMMPMMGVWGWGHIWNGGVWDGTGTTWMWLIMSIVPLLVILGFGYLFYSALRRHGTARADPALEELRAAYARGDLTEEEYEKRRKRLEREK